MFIFHFARAHWRRLIKFLSFSFIHGGSLQCIVLDRRGIIKSRPILMIFSKGDTFSAQVKGAWYMNVFEVNLHCVFFTRSQIPRDDCFL